MAITLNLTAVLITAIICLTLCFVCKSGQEAKEKNRPRPNVEAMPRLIPKEKSDQEKHLMEYMEEQARKRGDIEP